MRTTYRRLTPAILLAVLLTSCLPARFAWYNFSDITDYRIFPSRPLPKSSAPFYFKTSNRPADSRLSKLDSLALQDKTVAVLIIRNDSLLFEHYYQGYDAGSTVASFSMAKSYTSALIGAAIAEGKIQSVNDPVTRYIPEWKGRDGFDALTIRHLLMMASGLKANESYYNPFGQAAKIYYGRNLRGNLRHLKMAYPPGEEFAYRSINTQVLGLVLERATGTTITNYLYEKIWKHLGTEYDASWSIDKKNNGLEKTFCCINARARDFAKFGRLFLNKGNWNGQQLLPAAWVEESTARVQEPGSVPYYKYQWWLARNGYYANGLHGEFIFVCPSRNTVMVRLGKDESSVNWPQVFDILNDRL